MSAKGRFDEAPVSITVANLHRSLRCGFFRTYMGNPITKDVQRRKLENGLV